MKDAGGDSESIKQNSTQGQLWVPAHSKHQQRPGAALGLVQVWASIPTLTLGLSPVVFGEKQAESQAYELQVVPCHSSAIQENSPSAILLTDMNVTLAMNQFSAKTQQSL